MIQPHDLLDAGELAQLLGVTADSLRAMRAHGPDRYPRLRGMPEPLRTVGGKPVWRRADIEEWMTR